MKFSKYYQPNNRCGGRKPSAATLAKRAAEAEARKREELERYEAFEKAESGSFNGFEFPNVFHEHFCKRDAIYSAEADDCATVHTPFGDFKTGEDGITAYFFSENPTKTVVFNRSIYFI